MACPGGNQTHRMALPPQLPGFGEWVELPVLPPGLLTADAVERSMMERAERHHPLVAHLAPQGPGLGVAQVVGMAGTGSSLLTQDHLPSLASVSTDTRFDDLP